MMFKLAQAAAKRWRRLDGHNHIIALLEGKKFVNGIQLEAA
jgi:putative transposase